MIYIVSGFMRSGTSMLMACLEVGGLSVVKSDQREAFGKHFSDESYRVNKGGIYEPNPSDMKQPDWPRQLDGKAIKVVAPWLNALSVHDYEVCFMRRDVEEIRQSYEAAFSQKLKVADIENCICHALESLANRRDVRRITTLDYANVIHDPLATLQSLRWPINVERAAAVVDPELYRFRLERLTVGI